MSRTETMTDPKTGGIRRADLPANYPHPVGWQLLVRLQVTQEKSKGGIYIPEIAREDSRHLAVAGEVVAMGPRCYSRDDMGGRPWVSIGDFVMFEKYTGRRFNVAESGGGQRELRIMNDDDIQAIVDNPDEILPYMILPSHV